MALVALQVVPELLQAELGPHLAAAEAVAADAPAEPSAEARAVALVVQVAAAAALAALDEAVAAAALAAALASDCLHPALVFLLGHLGRGEKEEDVGYPVGGLWWATSEGQASVA